MKATYIQHSGDDLLVVNAARCSMGKKSDWECEELTIEAKQSKIKPKQILSAKDSKLIHYLATHQHMTPFEHCSITLHLKVPIFIARQIHRHRTFAFNEISRRYVDDNLEFYWPDKWRKRAESVKQGSSDEDVGHKYVWHEFNKDEIPFEWMHGVDTTVVDAYKQHCESCKNMYESMLHAGVAPEQARMILPQSLYSEFYMTGSLRNFVHFLKLRLDAHAQLEAQEIANQMAKIIEPLYPVSYSALMGN